MREVRRRAGKIERAMFLPSRTYRQNCGLGKLTGQERLGSFSARVKNSRPRQKRPLFFNGFIQQDAFPALKYALGVVGVLFVACQNNHFEFLNCSQECSKTD